MRGGTASQAIVARSATGAVADVAISAATIVSMLAAALRAAATAAPATAMPTASVTSSRVAAVIVLVSNSRRDESHLQGRFQIAGPQPDEHCK